MKNGAMLRRIKVENERKIMKIFKRMVINKSRRR